MRLSVIGLLALEACVTANIPQSVADLIPENATAIRLYAEQAPAEYFTALYRSIATEGFRMAQSDNAMGTLATEAKDIGQGTTLRLDLVLSASGGGSVAVLRGEWGFTATMAFAFSGALGASTAGGGAEAADWGKTGRPRAAFGELAMIASRLPHARLEYVVR